MSVTFEKIQVIIMDQLGENVSEITLTTKIKTDLDADSLDLFQAINDIEDEFGIEIDTKAIFETVGDLVAYVDSKR